VVGLSTVVVRAVAPADAAVVLKKFAPVIVTVVAGALIPMPGGQTAVVTGTPALTPRVTSTVAVLFTAVLDVNVTFPV